MMRRVGFVALAATAAAGLAACGSTAAPSASVIANPAPGSYTAIQTVLYQKGALTVATDKPAYPPWFEGNNPANGKGYESAVAYAVAKQLGFKNSQVKWAYE